MPVDAVTRKTVQIARALSYPVRLMILDQLRGDGAYVMHLTTVLQRPQANTSQHLMVLREAGLVVAEREGMTVVYRIKDKRVPEIIDALKNLAADDTAEQIQFRSFTEHKTCPCPRCQRRKH